MNKEKNYLLTFELDKENEILEIHVDQNGLNILKDYVDLLLRKGGSDHLHLMTGSWGGSELSEEKQCEGNTLINHVKIFKWK